MALLNQDLHISGLSTLRQAASHQNVAKRARISFENLSHWDLGGRERRTRASKIGDATATYSSMHGIYRPRVASEGCDSTVHEEAEPRFFP